MLDGIIELDKNLLIYINSTHNWFFDWFMVFISNKYSALPIYVYILFSCFYKRNYKVTILMILTIVVTFGLCDFLSVHLFKEDRKSVV